VITLEEGRGSCGDEAGFRCSECHSVVCYFEDKSIQVSHGNPKCQDWWMRFILMFNLRTPWEFELAYKDWEQAYHEATEFHRRYLTRHAA
jgi:hypothetical protein